MAYKKQNFVDGQILTADHLNHMEEGIANAGGGSGGSAELDTTLSQSGMAADAKAVGTALAGKQPIGAYVRFVNGVAPDASGNVAVSGGSSDGAAITFFDLAAMGLPAVTPDGTEVALDADTSEMQTALASGSVKFGFQLSYGGMTVYAEMVGAPMYTQATGTYQVSRIITMAGTPMFGSITISGTGISAVANVLQAALPEAEGASF